MPENTREVPILSRLSPPHGAVQNKKRKGRGVGSTLGKTAGRGMKGQKARHPGHFSRLAFEGGQMPLHRRLPKTGFVNPFKKTVAAVNVGSLSSFEKGANVDAEALRKVGLIKRKADYLKILGGGELKLGLTVHAHAFSASAKEKIEKAGGKIVEIPTLDSKAATT